MATILCIDDNRNVLELHKAVLESNGYKVLIAADSATVIALTRNHAIDTIVLDFNMPGIDGDQLAGVITKEQPAVPVVICSEHIDEIPESLRWFADALVEKANASDTLLSTLARIIDQEIVPKGMSTQTKLPSQKSLAAYRQEYP